MNRDIPYTFYVSEKSDNDRAIIRMISAKEEAPFRFFTLSYIPPFQTFEEIKKFQKMATYRPFEDGLNRNKAMAINLEEWIGHEEEPYLETFFRFLHDYAPFLKFEYIFTAGKVTGEQAEPLRKLMKKYLGEGEAFDEKGI